MASRSEWKVARICLWWGMAVTCAVALIQGAGSLQPWSVITLAVLGGAAASTAIFEHGWQRAPLAVGTPIRALILLALVWIPMGFLAYRAWPTGSKNRDAEFEAINQFLSEKSEEELRDTFDTMAIERDGILLAKQSLTPNAVSRADSDSVQRDAMAGNMIFFYRYIDTTTPNQVRMKPGEWGILVATRKYVENTKLLDQYSSSAFIPKEVSTALKNFQQTLSDNNEILIDSINEGYSTSH